VTDPTIRIVTTHKPSHWAAYVRRNLESVLDFLPYEVVSYFEGATSIKPDFEHHRLVWRDLSEVPGHDQFVAETDGFPPAQGLMGGKYDYNFDARRFSHKVYAQCDAAEEDCDVLIWLDSDVEALAPLSVGDVENTLNGMAMAIYQRPHTHTETGIVFWDMRQALSREFFRHYRHLYDSRRIYTIAGGWHDCWAMDAVIKALAIPVTNLTARQGAWEVVSTSELAGVFRHDKGPRKHAA
jgi:hypothetical protein